MKVSVVVPTYNRPEMLYRTLYSLQRQNDTNYEVLVSIDDDSDVCDESIKIVDKFISEKMPVQYFSTGKYKRGEGWSVETYPYNVGIRHATGDMVILNSGDVMSVTNNIAEHRQKHLENQNSVIVATVHAVTVDVQNKMDTYDWKNNPSSLLFKGSTYKMFSGQGPSFTMSYDYEEAHNPYHFQMSLLKKSLWDIGGFDEDYYGQMTCGDCDIADRLKRLGLNFVYMADILAIHQYHKAPEYITNKRTAIPNPKVESGHTLFHQLRCNQPIIRNANHEWGQYPRDMENLPDMSGYKE